MHQCPLIVLKLTVLKLKSDPKSSLWLSFMKGWYWWLDAASGWTYGSLSRITINEVVVKQVSQADPGKKGIYAGQFAKEYQSGGNMVLWVMPLCV